MKLKFRRATSYEDMTLGVWFDLKFRLVSKVFTSGFNFNAVPKRQWWPTDYCAILSSSDNVSFLISFCIPTMDKHWNSAFLDRNISQQAIVRNHSTAHAVASSWAKHC